MKKRFGLRHRISSLLVLVAFGVAVHSATADAPVGRYTIQAGGTAAGTVLDTKTGLTWQQAVPTGSSLWSDAGTYCASSTLGLPGSGWRLPSMKELQTIVDDSRSNPAIDPTAFPNTPVDGFWTSTTMAGPSGSAWIVLFNFGGSFTVAVGTPYYARCVR